MSYSFNVRATSKVLALAAVAVELAKVGESQPVHEFDNEQHGAAVGALVALAREPEEGEEISVSVCGSLGWSKPDPVPGEFSHVNLSVNVSVLAKTG